MTFQSSSAKPPALTETAPVGEQGAGKLVSVLALEFIASGKLAKGQVAELVKILVNDLKSYPSHLVEMAINKHRKSSPYWPSLSDLSKHMQPILDADQRRADRQWKDSKALEFISADWDTPPPTAAERARSQKLIDEFHKGVAEMNANENPREPFIFPTVSAADFEKIYSENPLFEPVAQRYEVKE